jgi:hypothetical protein
VKEEQEAQVMENRLAALEQADIFVGKYFSKRTVQKKVLRMTEEEIKEEQDLMDKEVDEGHYPSPEEQFQMDNDVHPDQVDAKIKINKAKPKPPAPPKK